MLADDAINNATYSGNNWAYNVKNMLDNLGLGYIWENQNTIEHIPYQVIKQRIFDSANQELMMSINTSTKLQMYSSFKSDTAYEPYLSKIRNRKYKFALSRLRLSSHSLAVETGRYNGTPREERKCTKCNMNSIENEYHFLLVCPHYIDIRRKYFAPYYCRWPSMRKFISLMQSKYTRTVNNLSKYIFYANSRRTMQ